MLGYRVGPTPSFGLSTMRLAFLLPSAALAVSLLLSVHPAAADEAAARAHFKKGIDLYDKKHFEEALTAFQDAYREKPSPGIKQNIALSLKGLGRYAEAATAFDEALDEGKDTLKPETRAAMERELAELTKTVATVNVSAVEPEERRPAKDVSLSIVPAAPNAKVQTVSGPALRRPIRLMPGIYTFTAKAPGHSDPPEKRLALVSGAPVDVTFAFGGASSSPSPSPSPAGGNEGMLKLGTNVPDAVIRVDGVDLPQRGSYSGKVAAGTHKVEISAPGWKTTTVDVVVASGATIDQTVKLQAVGEAPPEYIAPSKKPVKPKKAYFAVSGAVDTVSYRLGVPLGEPPLYGSRRSNFVGVSVGGRFGYLLTKMFAIEALVEAGGLKAKYEIRPSDPRESETNVAHFQLTPMARFLTPGKVRFTAATGFGLHALGVETKIAEQGSTRTKKGSGLGFSWLIDMGVQADAGPLFLEAALFLNVHGTGPVRDDDPPEDRLLYASPATRGGLRVGLGIPF
jgi:hypothetical protein